MADAKLKFSLEVDDNGTVKIKKFGQAVDETALKGGTFGSKMKAAAEGVGSLALGAAKAATALAGVATAMSIGIGTKSLAAFADYEQALIRMSVVSSESLDEIAKKMKQIPAELGTQTDVMLAYYEVLSAGVADYANDIDFLIEVLKLSKMEHIDAAQAVKGLSSVYSVFRGEISSTEQAIEKLYKVEAKGKITVGEMMQYLGEVSSIAKTVGLSYDELAASIALVSRNAASSSQTFTQLKALLVSLASNFEKLPESVKKFGTVATAIKSIGLEGVMAAIAKETNGSATQMQKMLGSVEAMNAALSLIANSGKDFTSTLGYMKEETELFNKKWELFENTLKQVWETFKATIGNILIDIGQKLAPAIIEAIKLTGEWMRAIQPKIVEWLGAALEGLPEKIASMRTEIMGAVEWFKNFIPVIETVLTVITGLAKGFLWLGDMIAQAMAKVAEFFDYFDRHPPVDVLVNFMGQGSSEAPLGEKIQEMQDKLEVFARVANFHARGTVEFVGEGGKPLGEALDYMTKKLEKLPLLAEETGKAFGKAAVGADKATKAYGGVKDAATGAAPAVDGMGQAVAESTDRFMENILVGTEMAYTMKSVAREFDESGVKLNQFASDMRQLSDEYRLWYEGSMRSAEGMKLSMIYLRAAQSAMESYREEVGRLEAAERRLKWWNGAESAAAMQKGSQGSRDFAAEQRANMRSYASGTGMGGLPYTGYYIGHQGEIVLNPQESKLFRSVASKSSSGGSTAAATGAGGGSQISITIAPKVMIGDRSGIRAVMPYLKEELDTYLRRTKTGWAA